MGNSQLSWETICSFLEVISKYRNNPYMKPKVIRAFLERCIRKDTNDAYDVFRLIFPESDSSRGSYGLFEYRLIYAILMAVEMIRPDWSCDAVALYRWRDKDSLALALGEPRELSALLKEKVFDHVCGMQKDMNVGSVNVKLDALASACGDINAQVDILIWFLERASAKQMAWLVQVISKNVRAYITERDVLEEWSEDALENMYTRGCHLSDILDGRVSGDEDEHVTQEGFVCGRQWYSQKPAYIRNVDDAHRYMERRFQFGSGGLMVVGEAHVDGVAIQAHRCDGSLTIFSRKKDDTYIMALKSPLLQMVSDNIGDFVVEGTVVAWNTSKLCFEPHFVLDAILSQYGTISNGFDPIDCPMYPSYKTTNYADIEIIILVSDVLRLGDEMLVHQALELRLESLEAHFKYVVFDRRNEEGFPVRVKIVPQIPNVSTIAGVLLSTTSSNVDELLRYKEEAESIGANGITLRALEPDWNSPDKFSRVFVLKTLGKFVVHCAVIGAWRQASGSVSHWLLGIKGQHGMISVLKIKNDLHSRDIKKINSSLDIQHEGFCSFDGLQQDVIVMIAATVVPAGKWNDTLALENPDIVGISSSSSPSTTEDIQNMILHRQDTMGSTARYNVSFKGRSVPKRFLPCDLSKVYPVSNVLEDHVIYFVNYEENDLNGEENRYASRAAVKCSCEEIVKKLGGTVSQNYVDTVAFVVAGHATRFTECFKEKNIAVLSLSWLKRLYQTCPETLPRITEGDYLPNWTPSKVRARVDAARLQSAPEKGKERVRKEPEIQSPKNTFSSLRGRFDAACSPQSPAKKPKPTLLEPLNIYSVSRAMEHGQADISRILQKAADPMEETIAPSPPIANAPAPMAETPSDPTGPREATEALHTTTNQETSGNPKKLSLKERAKLLRLG